MDDDLTPEDGDLSEPFASVTAPSRLRTYAEAGAGTGERYGAGRPRSQRAALAGVAAVAVVAASFGAVLTLRGHTTGTPAGAYAAPPAVSGAQMAYHPGTQRVVLFGGDLQTGSSNQTWLWDGTGWYQAHPAHSPSSRAGGQMQLDPTSGDLVLVGGHFTEVMTPAATCPPDEVQPDSGVVNGSAANGAVATAQSGTIKAVPPAFNCAVGSTGGSRNDTWTWDGNDWSNRGSDSSITQIAVDTAHGDLYGLGYATPTGTVAPASCSGGGSGGGSGVIVPNGTGVSGSANGSGGTTTGIAPRATAAADVAGTPGSAPGGGPTVGSGGGIANDVCIAPTRTSLQLFHFADHAWQRMTSGGVGPTSAQLFTTQPSTGDVAALTTTSAGCPSNAYCACPLMGAATQVTGGAPEQGTATNTMIACCGGPPRATTSGTTSNIGAPSIACPAPVPCPTAAPGQTQTWACPATADQTTSSGTALCPAPTCGGAASTTVSVFDGLTWTASTSHAITEPTAPHAYEPSRRDIVALRGDGTTWTSSTLLVWTQQHPAQSPGSYSDAAMAFDDATGTTVLFGVAETKTGSGTAQTWLWDGSTWKQPGPVAPSAPATATPVATPPSCDLPEPVNAPTEPSAQPDQPAVSTGDATVETTPGGILTTAPPTTPAPSIAPSPCVTPAPSPTPVLDPTPKASASATPACGSDPAAGVCAPEATAEPGVLAP